MIKILDKGVPAKEIIQATEAAGAKIMSFYDSTYKITTKDDNSPLTEADLASHNILNEALPAFIDIPMLSEEKEVPWEERKQWQKFWLIDPLDGTKGFIKRSDDFTINIAIIEEQKPIFGLLYLPVTKEMYCAARGQGAFRRGAEGWEKITVMSPQNSRLIVAGSSHHYSPKMQDFIQRINHKDFIAAGSALKFTRVAEGGVMLYPRFNPTSLWDTAAGQCLVEEAGGKVVDYQMRPLLYNFRADTLNPSFIAHAYDDGKWSKHWQEVAATAQ